VAGMVAVRGLGPEWAYNDTMIIMIIMFAIEELLNTKTLINLDFHRNFT
jgi:hypothetical protein